MIPTPIEAVTLDVDGTLYSIPRAICRNFFRVLPLLGFFRDLQKVRHQLRGKEPLDDIRLEQARLMAKLRGMNEQTAVQMVDKVVDELFSLLLRKAQPYPGLMGTLQQLIQRNIRLGIISDYPIRSKLDNLGLSEKFFGTLIVTEQYGTLKPHPLPFLRACQDLNLSPERVLHIGDREDCDVAGAMSSGMRTALFYRGRIPASSRADIVFSDWTKLIGILEKQNLLRSQ